MRPQFQAWLGNSPWVDPVAFAVVFVISLIVLVLISRWISALVRASPIGGLDRTLGLVFGLARGAALAIIAYIGAGMVVPVVRWPEPVLKSESVWPVYLGARWVVDQLPPEFRPGAVSAPPRGRDTAAADLLQATRKAGQWDAERMRIEERAGMALTSPQDDKFHEECGVFGVWNVPDAAAVTALGLHALQHRGQESTGIVTFDGSHFHSHRGLGLVGDNFGDARVIAALPGATAIGHNRYATTGDTILRNVQPLYADFEFGGFAVAHNGNLTNSHVLRRTLVRRGCLFQSTTDSEVFVHLIAISLYSTVVDRLIDALKQVIGAYSLVALSTEALMGVRDPLGVRPLILGRIGNEGTGGWVLASETCALDIVGADFVRDVEPGELVVINDQGVHSIKPFGRSRERFCVFEYIYFARPDSIMEGTPVYDARKRDRRRTGARDRECPPTWWCRCRTPACRRRWATRRESGIPFELGIIRNHYVGRTFIEPTDHIRHLGVKLKHSANRSVLEGKRVILVDDSIVRGTTSRKIVEMVRAGGRARGAYADFLAADDAFLLLRHRHAGARRTAGGAALGRRDGRADRRRQPGVHLDRRAVPRAGQARTRQRPAALLRRLLHRRLSDQPARSGRQLRAAAESAGGESI